MRREFFVHTLTNRNKIHLLKDSKTEIQELPKFFEANVVFTRI